MRQGCGDVGAKAGPVVEGLVMTEPCYACTVAQVHPATKLRGHADCISCDARALAREFGGLPIDTTTRVMTQAWPEVQQFRRGRALFWSWAQRIEEARLRAIDDAKEGGK
jgi:hypothetical protein